MDARNTRLMLLLLLPLGSIVVFGADTKKTATTGITTYSFTSFNVPNESQSATYGINDLGQVVGSFLGSNGRQAFLYDGTTFTTFSQPLWASDINNLGQIIGHDGWQGWFINPPDPATTIQYPGASGTFVDGINEAGDIGGTWWDGGLTNHAFRRIAGTFSSFDCPGAIGTYAQDINNLGQLVGNCIESGGEYSFIYDGTTFSPIRRPRASTTVASGINDHGWISGYSDIDSFIYTGTAFIQVHYPGGHGMSVQKINNNGQFVGGYLDSGGTAHDFIATPVTFTPTGSIAGDFSVTSNPSFAWTFGYTATLGGAFTAFPESAVNLAPNVDAWVLPGTDALGVYHATSVSSVSGPTETDVLTKDMLVLHPGPAGQYSIVRWTAPKSAAYRIEGTFTGQDSVTSAASSDVHILLNSTVSLAVGLLHGLGTSYPFSVARTLNAGDTIDFAVGFGGDASQNDSTGLQGAISDLSSPAFVLAGSQNGISVFRLDPATGLVSPVTGSPLAANLNVRRVASDPQGRFIYATYGEPGQVAGFTIDANTGGLTAVTGSPFGAGQLPAQVLVHPSGKFLYVSNEDPATNQPSDYVTGYSIDQTTGALTPLPGSPFTTGVSGFDMTFNPTGTYAFVVSNYGGLAILSTNTATGSLTPIPGSPFPLGYNLSSVVAHPNGRFIYVADQVGQHVWALEFFPSSSSFGQLPGSPYHTPFAHWVTLTPGGQHLYASNNWSSLYSTVTGYDVDPGSGGLTPIAGSPFQAGTGPDAIAVDPTGRFAYATNTVSTDLWSFKVNQQTGALTPNGQSLPVGPSPDSVIVVMPSASPTGTISVTTNTPAATFTITGPATYSGGGTSFTQTNAPVGTYTITYGATSCFATPPSKTFTLAAGGAVSFSGSYQGAATVSVSVTPIGASSATFSISPVIAGMRQTGPYPVIQPNAWPQSYTVTFTPVSGFTTPPSQTLAPSSACTVAFMATYAQIPASSTAGVTVHTSIPASFSVYQSGTQVGSGYQDGQLQLPAPGTYTVKYSPQTGYYTPLQQTIAVNPGDSVALRGAYRRLLLVSFSGFYSAPNPPSCTLWLEGFSNNVGSGVQYSQANWNLPGTGIITLLYEVQQTPALSPGAHMAGFTYYSTDGHGHQLGNACGVASDADHVEATNWFLSQNRTSDDIVAVIGHSYGGNRARLFVDELKNKYGIPVDFLATVDPIDWDVCNLQTGFAQFLSGSAYNLCDLSQAQYLHAAAIAQSFRQVQGIHLVPSPAAPFSLKGYSLYNSSVAIRPDYHDTIDDDTTVHTTMTSGLLSLIRGPQATAVPGPASRSASTLTIPLRVSITGIGTATAVVLTSVSLNGTPATNLAAVATLGDVAAGASSSTVTLVFPGGVASPGSVAALVVSGTYSYGQTFTNTFPRITIP